ncbi:MAG: hypothetical protein Q9176_002892 [Flavoplaca citrina]
MIEEYQRHQLLPGRKLDNFAKAFVCHVDKMVSWQQVQVHVSSSRPVVSASVDISLMDWTTDVFLHATTETYWGRSIWGLAPNLIESFQKWEQTTWKYIFQVPRILSKDIYDARDELIAAFTAYFGQAKTTRADANYFVTTSEQELRDIAFNDNDVGKVHMLQYWAINGNAHKVTFWMFAYMLHDPQLLERIRQEVAPGIENGTVNVPYLTEQRPRLESLFLEVLRLKMSSSLMRYVTEPTVVGGKFLARGHNVMVPYRQLHLDEDVWGKNASAFDPDRFLNDKQLSQSSSFRPFGGGQHLCPGRFVARQAIFSFIALALARFEIGLAPHDTSGEKSQRCQPSAQRFPRTNESKPALGALAPVAGDRVMLRVGLRRSEKPEHR